MVNRFSDQLQKLSGCFQESKMKGLKEYGLNDLDLKEQHKFSTQIKNLRLKTFELLQLNDNIRNLVDDNLCKCVALSAETMDVSRVVLKVANELNPMEKEKNNEILSMEELLPSEKIICGDS